jgi:PAS domain S-box-containing protein
MIEPIPEKRQQAQLMYSPRFFSLHTDLEGMCVSSNDLFKDRFYPGISHSFSQCFINSISPQFINKYREAIKECIAERTTIAIELQHHAWASGPCAIYWELSLVPGEMQIQWTGMAREDGIEKKNGTDPLRQSELFYRALFADSLDGVLLVNETGVISFSSASVVNILGYEPENLIAQNCFDYVHPDDRELGMSAFRDELIQSPKQKFIAIRLLQKSGEWLWCMVRGHNLIANPAVGKMLVYFCDDRFRRSAESALVESRERFADLIQNLNIGIVVCDPDGSILLCNRACIQIVKLPEKELVGKSVFDDSFKLFSDHGNPLKKEEYPIARSKSNGSVVRNQIVGVDIEANDDTKRIWLEVNAQPVFDEDKKIKHIICSFTDITEKRKLEQEIKNQDQQKQKQLMQATIDGQERERSEISRELHDNISQHLTTTRIYLEVVKDQAEGQFFEMIGQAHKSLIYISHEIRRLSQSLAPPELRDIGLVESIRDLCNLLRNAHTLSINFEHEHLNEERIPDTMKLMLFRIIQEQINNIIRHAGAHSISIKLEADVNELRLSIADDGKGFDVSLVKKGLGLINIINRIELFDGTADIMTSPGKGCVLQVKAPLG